MRQYIITYKDYAAEFKDIDMAYTLGLLEDRMRSSIKRPQFHDKNGDPYIIYTIDELEGEIFKSRPVCVAILKKLEKLGYVVKKRQFNGPNLIYLPKFEQADESKESELPKVQKLNSNQINHNQPNKLTSNTVNTEPDPRNQIDDWRTAVIEKSKLPSAAVDAILRYTNFDLKLAYKIVGLINKAKYLTAKANGLLNKPETRFESNLNIQQRIASKLSYIFNYAKNMDNSMGYIMGCLKRFFLEAFGIKKDEVVHPVIPGDNQSGKIDIRMPEWMKEPYDPEKDKISKEDKDEVEKLLEEFYKNE